MSDRVVPCCILKHVIRMHVNVHIHLRDLLTSITCTIYKISVHVVSDIQTRAEGERYVQYNTNASTYEICKVLM